MNPEFFPSSIDIIEKERIIPSTEKLPSLQEGYVRLVHLTNQENVSQIQQDGLDYEKHGMVTSVARPYISESDVEYYSDDPRFSGEGIKAIVIDIPKEEYQIHNNISKSPGKIPPEYIVGIIDTDRPKK